MTTPDAETAAGTAMPRKTGTQMRPAVEPATTSSASDPGATSSPGSRRMSSPSSTRSGRSMPRYKRPDSVKALVAQVSDVATRVLAGGLTAEEMDEVRLYASLARTSAQLITTEVTRSRFVREEPDLTLPEPEIEGG